MARVAYFFSVRAGSRTRQVTRPSEVPLSGAHSPTLHTTPQLQHAEAQSASTGAAASAIGHWPALCVPAAWHPNLSITWRIKGQVACTHAQECPPLRETGEIALVLSNPSKPLAGGIWRGRSIHGLCRLSTSICIRCSQFFDSVLVQAHEYKYAVMADASSSM